MQSAMAAVGGEVAGLRLTVGPWGTTPGCPSSSPRCYPLLAAHARRCLAARAAQESRRTCVCARGRETVRSLSQGEASAAGEGCQDASFTSRRVLLLASSIALVSSSVAEASSAEDAEEAEEYKEEVEESLVSDPEFVTALEQEEAPALNPLEEPSGTPVPVEDGRPLAAEAAAEEPPLDCSTGAFRSPNLPGIEFGVQDDVINACSYAFPLTLPMATRSEASSVVPSWIVTRYPERYSSAAPLSSDARLRIVSERLLALRGVVISVAISPPNATFLPDPVLAPAPVTQEASAAAVGAGAGVPSLPASWTPINVTRSVLADRTSPRMTSVQRLQETVVGNVSSADFCGARYFYCEYLNARSPTTITGPGSKEVFRHSVAVSAEREGYLYTLTASCLDADWAVLGDSLRAAVSSFRLLPPTSSYVPPWKDPWRFW